MPAIQRLLERWGFIKLGRYGLARTPEGRILSMRPAVLDDGAGGRIVGWRDGDPAIAELRRWPAVTQPTVSAQPAASGAVIPVEVAPEPPVDEDDWEWTIALARARAAAEEADIEPSAAKTREMPAVTIKELVSCEAMRPEREAYDDYSQVTTRPGMAALASLRAPAPATLPRIVPATVIPVPTLPSVHTSGVTRLEPVVRSAQVPPASPNRFPKGTAPVSPRSEARDDTDPNVSVGDHTRPGIGMPTAARVVSLPSIKRPR